MLKESNPQDVTSERSANVKIIAGANAVGTYIPLFYVFMYKRWTDNLLEGAWHNVRQGMVKLKNIRGQTCGIVRRPGQRSSIIMYDGHKSHQSLTLTEGAKRNVMLYVLPPHTSHLTQPLDLAVFLLLKSQYYKECQTSLQRNPGISITRYEVAKLTAKP